MLLAKQVAALLGITIDNFYYLRKAGKFIPPSRVVGGKYGKRYWMKDDVLEWLKMQAVTATAECGFTNLCDKRNARYVAALKSLSSEAQIVNWQSIGQESL